MAFTLLRRGQLIAVPPPEKALRFLEPDASARARGARRPRAGPAHGPRRARSRCASSSSRSSRDYGAEEAIAVNITYEHEARRRSYELLAEAFGLCSCAGALDAPL